MELTIRPAGKADFISVVELLSQSNLPTADLHSSAVELLVGVLDGRVVASIGMERYGNVGLLRSLAVSEPYKNRKIGDMLVVHLLETCTKNGVGSLYLLTTTAERYFERYGFCSIGRHEVPEAVRQTQEFKDICPASAAVMCKKL